MRVTIKHVAQVAGVSHTTVSRVLHDDPRISESTRIRVLEAAKKLNYRPNIMARGLVNQQTYLIGLIVPDIFSSFYPEIIQGIEEVTNQKGYSIILCTSEDDFSREMEHVISLLNKGVDGLIISGINIEKMDKTIAQDNKPVVFLAEKIDRAKGLFVGVNDIQIGMMATEHLIQHGHKNIAHLAGNPDSVQSEKRKKGFIQALDKHNIHLPPDYIIQSRYTIEGGYKSGKELLKLNPRPTAVYAGSDYTAIGAIQAFREAGLSVPEDIAIIGTDDILIASLVEKPLTTVSQPKRKMGIISAQMLIRAIEGKQVESTELDTKLVIRQTCGTQNHIKTEV